MQTHDGDRFELRIGDTFTFTTADGVEKSLQPEEDPAGLGPVLGCTRDAAAPPVQRGHDVIDHLPGPLGVGREVVAAGGSCGANGTLAR
jgi:hypothetical protein